MTPTQPPLEPTATSFQPGPTGTPGEPVTENNGTNNLTPEQEAAVQDALSRMTLEEKLAQLFVIGFDGLEMNPELHQMITDIGVGGVIYFARNVASPEQVARLTSEMQAAAREAGRPGLLIAVDQEGGRVARLTEVTGFTEFPSAMALTAGGSLGTTREVASAMADEMRAVGFNVNFAPDLDVNNNPDNPVIGLRSFGSDPAQTAAFGAAFIEGLQRQGVMAFGKHFPGHGDTSTDSHLSLPVVPHERARLEQVEFVPFQAAMQAGAAGIMSAHVTFPAIAPDRLPATLSPEVMTGLLRNEMGFTGLLATDSLEMGALGESGYPGPMAAAQAFAAGADLLLFNRDHALHRAAYQLTLDQVRKGIIPAARVEESAARMLSAKARFGLLDPAPLDLTAAAGVVGNAAHRELSTAAARAAVTLVRDDAGILPFSPDNPPLVVQVAADFGLGALLDAPSYTVMSSPLQAEIDMAVNLPAEGQPVLIVTLDAKTNPAQADLVQAMVESGSPVVVIAARNPYDLMAFPYIETYLTTYGHNPPMITALAQVLTGQAPPSGRLPVELPGLYPTGHGLQGYGD